MSPLRSDFPPLQADNLHAVSRGQFIWMFNQMAWRSVKSNGGFSGCGILSLQLVSNVCQFCQLLCHVLAWGGVVRRGMPYRNGFYEGAGRSNRKSETVAGRKTKQTQNAHF